MCQRVRDEECVIEGVRQRRQTQTRGVKVSSNWDKNIKTHGCQWSQI